MAPTAWPAGKSARRSTECLCGGGQAALGLGSVLTFEEGRGGAWNRGSPPRARLLLRARVAAATRRRRTRAGGPRSSAEDEEAKADTDGIAAALGLVLRGGGRPSKRRRGWYRRAVVLVFGKEDIRSSQPRRGVFCSLDRANPALLDESGQPTTKAAAWPEARTQPDGLSAFPCPARVRNRIVRARTDEDEPSTPRHATI